MSEMNMNMNLTTAEQTIPEPEVVICAHCGTVIAVEDAVVVDGDAYCACCFNDLFTVCEHCEEYVRREDAAVIYGDTYCENCVDELFTTCDCCGQYVTRDNAMDVDGDDFCEDCFDELFTTCDCCGCYVRREDVAEVGLDEYCESCFDELFTTCDRCGDPVRRGNAVVVDGGTYCEDCAEDVEGIHDYGYNPAPEFYEGAHSDPDADIDLYMGVELEVDKGNNANSLAKDLTNLTDMLYCKHDSSLSNGVEIVTHPCTLYAHRSLFPWGEVLSKCSDRGFKSHDAGTCGLHVHVSRSAFEGEKGIFTAVALVDRLRSYIVRFSRRSVEKLNRWAQILDTTEIPPYLSYELVTGWIAEESRYVAVNLQNDNTVEFRFPRGSLRYDTVLATIELCRNIVLYARTHEPADVASAVWEDVIGIGGEDGTNTELLRYWGGRNHDGLAPKELDAALLVPATPAPPKVRIGDVVKVNDFFRRSNDFNPRLEDAGVFGIVLDTEAREARRVVRVVWFDSVCSPMTCGHNLGSRLRSGSGAGWNVYEECLTVVRHADGEELHLLLDNIINPAHADVEALIRAGSNN